MPFTGLSTLTAEIGLVSYTLLILIRNIVTGLDGVSPDAKEAAIGMGYTDRQLLWKVEIPLAIPAIAAGVRIATVTTIGLVTVTSLIGQGGLGYFILLGLQQDVLDGGHPRRGTFADPRDHHRHAAARHGAMADPVDPST